MAAIELPDEVAQRLREAAAEDGMSVDEWVTVALRKIKLERADPRERLRRVPGVRVPDRVATGLWRCNAGQGGR
jgi:hypothetical protein